MARVNSRTQDLLITQADPAIIPDSVTGVRSLKPSRAGPSTAAFHSLAEFVAAGIRFGVGRMPAAVGELISRCQSRCAL